MGNCEVDRCDEVVSKKGHTLCREHWGANRDGELTKCEGCARLKKSRQPLCSSCFAKGSESSNRKAGQGAREKADAIASKNPLKSLLSKVTFGLVEAPDYSWRVGAESEEAVGRELEKLSSRHWIVVHDRMIGRRWNVDHVAVGPPGAFVLDTKFRSGDVKTTRRGIVVEGRKSDMAEAVQDQAREISGRLSGAGAKAWVQPVLVFDNDVRGSREPDGVHVVGIEDLVEYLTQMPREIDAAEIRLIGAALRRDDTWE